MFDHCTKRTLRAAVALAVTVAAVGLWLGGCKPAHSSGAGDEHGHGDDHGAETATEHADEVVLTEQAIFQHGIKVEGAQLWQLRPTFVVPARVSFNAEAMAHVGSPLQGRVVAVKAGVGDAIKAGDALAIVESPELGAAQSEFLVKTGAAGAGGPPVELAKSTWERARSLYDKTSESTRSIGLTEVQAAESVYAAATAALKSAQAEAQAAENRLRLLGMSDARIAALAQSGEVDPRMTIVAPMAGRVVQREVSLGELVSPDRDALFVIADMTTLWVLADVPEARLAETAVGAPAWVGVGGVKGARMEGTVGFISPMLNASTRTAQVRIEVASDNDAAAAGALRPGMFALAEIVGSDATGAEPTPTIAVPEDAVQTVEGGPAVFVPVAGEVNTFARRAVTIGRTVSGLVPIYAGLVEGEPFVSSGSFILKAELGKSEAGHEH